MFNFLMFIKVHQFQKEMNEKGSNRPKWEDMIKCDTYNKQKGNNDSDSRSSPKNIDLLTDDEICE